MTLLLAWLACELSPIDPVPDPTDPALADDDPLPSDVEDPLEVDADTIGGGRDERFTPRFSAWDIDDDWYLSEEEWERGWDADRGYVGTFSLQDVDTDGTLTMDEHAEGLIRVWDADGDGELDRGELRAMDRFTTPSTATGYARFEALDSDDSGTLDGDELAPMAADRFAAWDLDGDGRLTPEEWRGAHFDAWDRDADGRIDAYEARWR